MGVDFMSVSVPATVIGAEPPEPDPDREHCVRLSFYGSYHYDVSGTRLDTTHRGYMNVYSQYPIHMDTADDGNVFINVYEPSTNKTRVEFETLIHVEGTDYGNNDFNYHNFDIERDVTGATQMGNTYYPDTGRVVFSNCHALNELYMVDVPNYQSILNLYCFRSYYRNSSHYGEYQSLMRPLELAWYVGSNSKVRRFQIGNIEDENTHCSYTVYNFNNPIFASGDAWLAYCKEQV